MNRLLLMIGVLIILIMPRDSWAMTTSQYPNPNRQTMWNNITDGVHTLGQDPQQTQVTLRRLHGARTRARSKSINLANQAKFKAKRQAWLNSQQ